MPVYTNPVIDQEPSSKVVYYVDNKCALFTCNGSPEGVILANTGSIALSDNGSVFKKTTDDLTTGWIELTGGTQSSPFAISGINPTLSLIDTTVGDDDGAISMITDNMSITVVGGTPLILKPSGQIIGIPRNINLDVSVVGNVGGGVDTLHTFTVPINTLANDNDYLSFFYSGPLALNDNDKSLGLTFGGTNFVNTGALDVDGGAWEIHGRVIRISNVLIRAICVIHMGFVAISSVNAANGGTVGGVYFTQTAEIAVADLNTNTLVLSVICTGVANDDIRQNLSEINLVQLS